MILPAGALAAGASATVKAQSPGGAVLGQRELELVWEHPLGQTPTKITWRRRGGRSGRDLARSRPPLPDGRDAQPAGAEGPYWGNASTCSAAVPVAIVLQSDMVAPNGVHNADATSGVNTPV